MRAVVVTSRSCMEFGSVDDLKHHFTIKGYTKDLSADRARGALVRRAELDNQPILDGFAGPMWDSNCLRYEDWQTYELMSM